MFSLDDPALATLAATVDDLEGQRKATENRIRILTCKTPDKDGEMRGFGYDEDHPSVLALTVTLGMVNDAEAQSIKSLEKCMKQHPLGPWVANQKGLGMKTIARLLGEIGDPYWMKRHAEHPTEKTPEGKPKLIVIEDRPRTVSELWAYCGLDARNGAAPRRRAGQRSNWKSIARVRAYNCLDPIIKAKNNPGPYTTLFYDTKDALQGTVYTQEYIDAWSAKASPGDPIPPWLVMKRAKRIVMKEILKDLWIESKRLHEEAALPIAA